MFSERLRSLDRLLSIIYFKCSAIITSNISVIFFLIWCSNYMWITHFIYPPTLGYSDIFLMSFHFLCILILENINIFSSSLILSSALSSLLISPSKVFIISITVFFYSKKFLWFFLTVSIALLQFSYILHVLLLCKICIISESSTDAYTGFSFSSCF